MAVRGPSLAVGEARPVAALHHVASSDCQRRWCWLATLIIFLIANTVPGDPVLTQLGDVAANNPAIVAAYRHKWGLDLPMWDRYWIFLRGLAHGDLGISISSQRPVLEDIAQYAPATIELSTVAFMLSSVVGLPLGVIAAMKRDSWIDHLARAVSLIGVSAPTFWLAFIMLAVFYGWLGWAPGPGQIGADQFPPPDVTGFMLIDAPLAGQWDTFWDAIAHLILPSIVLAASTLGLITRTTRAAMLEVAVAGLHPCRARQGPAAARRSCWATRCPMRCCR